MALYTFLISNALGTHHIRAALAKRRLVSQGDTVTAARTEVGARGGFTGLTISGLAHSLVKAGLAIRLITKLAGLIGRKSMTRGTIRHLFYG